MPLLYLFVLGKKHACPGLSDPPPPFAVTFITAFRPFSHSFCVCRQCSDPPPSLYVSNRPAFSPLSLFYSVCSPSFPRQPTLPFVVMHFYCVLYLNPDELPRGLTSSRHRRLSPETPQACFCPTQLTWVSRETLLEFAAFRPPILLVAYCSAFDYHM